MDWNSVEGIAAAVTSAAAAAGAIIALIKKLKPLQAWQQRRSRAGHLAAYEANLRVMAVLQDLLNTLPVERVLLIKSHNGGGVPRPGSTMKVTVAHEVHKQGIQSTRENLQDFVIDAAYTALLRTLIEKRFEVLRVDSMPDGFLNLKFRAERIQQAFVAAVGFSSNSFYFLKCDTLQSVDEDAVVKIEYHLALASNDIIKGFALLPNPPALDETRPTLETRVQ